MLPPGFLPASHGATAGAVRCRGWVADRLVVDLNPDGTASVSAWLENGEPPGPAPSFALALPLDDEALEDLRW
jgi:hypothetical protein